MHHLHQELEGKSRQTRVQLPPEDSMQLINEQNRYEMRMITWCCVVSSSSLMKEPRFTNVFFSPFSTWRWPLAPLKIWEKNTRQTERMNPKRLPAAVKSCKCLFFRQIFFFASLLLLGCHNCSVLGNCLACFQPPYFFFLWEATAIWEKARKSQTTAALWDQPDGIILNIPNEPPTFPLWPDICPTGFFLSLSKSTSLSKPHLPYEKITIRLLKLVCWLKLFLKAHLNVWLTGFTELNRLTSASAQLLFTLATEEPWN